jgi:hypothetical protein
MRLILTIVSFPRGYTGMSEFLREQFGDLSRDQSAAMIVLPKGASISTMEGARLTVITADNFENAARAIAADHKEFDKDTTAGDRLYATHARMDTAYLQGLKDGTTQPESPDAFILANLLQTA